MGTTIMAVRYSGGVIMAADSRTTTGAYIANRASDKITSVHDKIFVCRSGSAADTQAVADIVRYYLSGHAIELGEEPRVKTAANLFKQVVYQNKDRLSAGIIIGGYDEHDGGSVYSVTMGGSLVKENVALGGSGSIFVYGLLDAEYKPTMSKEECLKFVRKAVSHAMARDGSSGGVIRTVVISKDGVEREMIPGDKLPFLAENHLF
jgi:20S proteasome subunit beta 1